MKKYASFRPSGFDPAGLGLPDRQDWRVLGVSRTRDSRLLETSNWDAAVAKFTKTCGPEHVREEPDEDMPFEADVGSGWEIHRFGHWGPGWFEIILLAPGSPAEKVGREIEAALDSYPVLDDTAYSAAEMEAVSEAWTSMRLRDRIAACARAKVSIFAARHDMPPESVEERLRTDL